MADTTHPTAAQPDAPGVLPGEILAGKYRVEHVLGKGGMGLVVAATHLQLDQLVALKFLLPDALKNPEVVGRFAREARAAVKLQSEHVARVSDVGSLESGAPFMVMEHLEGTDLSKTIDKEGALDVARAVDYVLQACEAIAEAHALGIVHRDLKPSNLFLAKRSDKRRIIKVLDFGISKMVSAAGEAAEGSLTRTTDVLGSPMYMSPEQLRSSRTVDSRTDIWSLGVILFELLTLEVPFQVGTLAEICGAILHEQPKTLRNVREDVPEELEEVILCCLEKDPRDRFASIAELAEALEPFGSEGAALSVAQIARFAPAPGAPDPELLKKTAVERPTAKDLARIGAAATARISTGSRAREASAARRRGGDASSQAKATNTSWDGKLAERPAPSRSVMPWVASVVLLAGLGVAAWRFGFIPQLRGRAAAASAAAVAPKASAAAAPTAAPLATAAPSASPSAPVAAAPEPAAAPSATVVASASAAASARPSASARAGALPGAEGGKGKGAAPASTLAAAIAAWGKVPEPPATAAAAPPPPPPPAPAPAHPEP